MVIVEDHCTVTFMTSGTGVALYPLVLLVATRTSPQFMGKSTTAKFKTI